MVAFNMLVFVVSAAARRAEQVFGEASNRMLEQLERKPATLGERGRVSVQPLHAGFARIGTAARSET